MSLFSNAEAICDDVYRCLSANGVNINKNAIYIDYFSKGLFVRALTNEEPVRRFSMRLSDKYIVCDNDTKVKFDLSPFKHKIEFKERPERDRKEEIAEEKEYINELFLNGEIKEEELIEELEELEKELEELEED